MHQLVLKLDNLNTNDSHAKTCIYMYMYVYVYSVPKILVMQLANEKWKI